MAVSLFLRLYRYPRFPIVGETRDEVAWSMLGASLLQTGQPSSWSYFAAYDDYLLKTITPRDESGQKTILHLVRPALDHPPLFSLIPGFFHNLKYDWDQLPSIKLIRAPMIVIGFFNLLLVYFLAKEFFTEEKWAYLATAIYGLTPTFVLSSRLVVAENLLATWILLALLSYKKLTGRKLFFSLMSLSILAVLTKIAGVIVPVSLILLGLTEEGLAEKGLTDKRRRLIWAGLSGLGLGFLLFLGYASVYNLPLFFTIQFSQAGRQIGLTTLVNRLFLHPAVVEKIFFDGWLWLGLMASLVLMIKKRKKYLPLFVFLLVSLLFNATTAGEQTFHAWYDYLFYPLLAIFSAGLIKNLIKETRVWLWWLICLILLPNLRLALSYLGIYQQTSALGMRTLTALGGLPLGLNLITKEEKWVKASFWLLLGIIFLAGALIIFLIEPRTYAELHQFFLKH